MNETWLVIETSSRAASLGLARGNTLIRSRVLDETRRLARDLAPAIGELLREEQVEPKSVDGVMVSVGPGSYTGLRVGIMSAKAFAYATGCKLIAVPTFAAIALQAPEDAADVWVFADALQGQIYLQRYANGQAQDELRIARAVDVLPTVPKDAYLLGPGLALHKLNDAGLIHAPSLEAVIQAGKSIAPLIREEMFALEPLYLRGSSAEEKASANGPQV